MPMFLQKTVMTVLVLLLSGSLNAQQQIAPTFDPNLNPQDGVNSGAPLVESNPVNPQIANPPANFPEAINEPMTDWMDWSEWESSAELGINGGSGNSQSFNVTTGFDTKRTRGLDETKIGFKYINNKSNDVLVASNARLNLDWERKFPETIDGGPSRWSWFVKNAYLYDDFRPFDLRVTFNTGLGYRFLENDVQSLKGRFGVGATKEIGGVNDSWVPEALFGLDYRRQLSKKQKLEATVDFFPSWEDFSDYRVVTDVSWEVLLDEVSNMSLKMNINDRYDSTPDGAKANDIFYSLLLLWKF